MNKPKNTTAATAKNKSAKIATPPKSSKKGLAKNMPANASAQSAKVPAQETVIKVEGLFLYYDDNEEAALKNISMNIEKQKVTSFIGPSGCGKSSLLRCFNRMNELSSTCRIEGKIRIQGQDIYDPDVNLAELRRNIGMVFQKPNPFPKSVYENVAYGLRIQGQKDKNILDEVVESSLRAAALWDEVKDRLDSTAINLSGGQQQRLVIARAIAVQPQVILLDEPASALDPISTLKIEELIHELKKQYTIVIVTHNMQQAARVSDYAAFLYLGKVVEFGKTIDIFTTPRKKKTEDYITGRYG